MLNKDNKTPKQEVKMLKSKKMGVISWVIMQIQLLWINMKNMTFIRNSAYLTTFFDVFQGTGEMSKYILWTAFYFTIGLIPSVCYIYLRDDQTRETQQNAILGYIIGTLVMVCLDHINNLYVNKLTMKIIISFQKKIDSKFEQMTPSSKCQDDVQTFCSKTDRACRSVIQLLFWGIPNLIQLIRSIVNIAIISCTQNLVWLMMILVAINVIVYLFHTKKQQEDYTKMRSEQREENHKTRELMRMDYLHLQLGMTTHETVIEKHIQIETNHMKQQEQWSKIGMTTNIVNNIPLVIIGYVCWNNVSLFIFVNIALQKFTSSVKNFMNFVNQLKQNEQSVESLDKFWDDKEMDDEKPDNEVFSGHIQIKRGQTTKDHIVHWPSIDWKFGDRVCVKGESGSGKSTFFQLLTGKKKGMKVNGQDPRVYYHTFTEFFQEIKENTPMNKTTVRQLFDDETNDQLIEYFCRAMRAEKMVKLKTDEGKSPFDAPIGPQRPSSGERTRLLLARTMYLCWKNRSNVLVFDEPEQGSDPPIGYQIIGNAIKQLQEGFVIDGQHYQFEKMIFIVVSHLEFIRKKFEWTHEYQMQKIYKNDDEYDGHLLVIR